MAKPKTVGNPIETIGEIETRVGEMPMWRARAVIKWFYQEIDDAALERALLDLSRHEREEVL